MMDYRQLQQPQGTFFPPQFPGQPGGQMNLTRRVNELERQVRQLEREQERLNRRVSRLESFWMGSPRDYIQQEDYQTTYY